MLHFNILTIFPELVENFFKYSILKKAVDLKLISYKIIDIREYSEDKHKVVDDTPFGGGSGMVLKIEPIYNALSSLSDENKGKVILLSAKGTIFDQEKAEKYAKEKCLTLICGRYEGIDDRVLHFSDEEVSIGNYVLMGGEVAAAVIIEALSRLVPGVVGKQDSIEQESFSDIFLEYPQYTRPRVFKNIEVPEILTSGNHKEIEKWRKEKQIEITLKNRPELIKNRNRALSEQDLKILKKKLKEFEIYAALVHYPVYNKNGEEVATATTNLDIHDIARVSKTYSISRYFIVTPIKEQQDYIKRIINHWKEGYGFKYNKNRANALALIKIIDTLDNCIKDIKKNTEKELLVIGTSAKYVSNTITIDNLKKLIDEYAVLLVFGTGWGLSKSILDKFDYMLEPIYGLKDFNHLPVRSAVSIIFDRLLGI